MRVVVAAMTLAPVLAYAGASAHVSIFNRTPTVVVQADGSTRAADGDSALLAPGERLTYSFDYTLTASDDGLPAFIGDGPFWNALAANVYTGSAIPRSIALNGTEFALANFYFDSPCASTSCPPWVAFSATWDFLATTPDDAPQALSKSGHGLVSFAVLSGWNVDPVSATLPTMRTDVLELGTPRSQVAEAFVRAVPAIPEPTEGTLVAVGLAMLVLRHVRRAHAKV